MPSKEKASVDNKQALKKSVSESLYQYITDSIFAPATFLADPENGYQLIYANLACLNFGIKFSAHSQASLTKFIPKISEENFNSLWHQVLVCGNATMLAECHNQQGQHVAIELSISQVKHLGQRLMLGHIRDATDQFQILETLAGKEQEFRSLAESSPYSIIRYDRDGYIRYLNAKLASDLGISLTEVIGQLPNEAWPDKRFDAIQQAAAKAVKSEVEVAIEIIGPEIFNVPSFHQIHIVPEKNAYGKVIGTVAFGIDITVQKQYTKSLLERAKLEEQLSGVAASVPGFIYSLQEDVNQKLRFSYASVGVEELFGLSPEDVCEEAETLWSRFHPEDVSRIFLQLQNSKLELSLCRDELRIYHPIKGLRWIEIRSTPQRYANSVTEWHGIMLDITERKLAQEATQHAQSALEDAQRIAHIGSWDVDILNDVLTWSDETFRIWEIDQTKFAATFAAFIDTVHPDDREKVTSAYNQSINDKVQYQVEHRLLFSDGRVKYIQERGEPFFDSSGRPIRFIGTSLDITERKAFEGLVSLQNHALDIMGEAVYLVDENARIHHVNNAACKMLGYTKAELVGLRITDFDPEYDPERWRQHWNELLHQKTITLETVHRSKAGILVPIEVNANAIEHEGQRFNFALVRNISERKHIEAQLQHQASYDMLTGLPNRRLFEDRLRDEINKATRSGSIVSLLFIDLDRFKEINDTLGHHQGDRLLIQAAQRIQLCMRESDTLARIGGDEFVVILSGFTEMACLGRIAQDIIAAMASPFVLDEQISYVSASIGIANYPSDVDSLEGLISAADQAMFVAKERGRNGFSFFTSAMQKEVQQRLLLANDLREAMHKEQLQIYLQPIIDISTGNVVKAEALIRWKHHQYGMVSPDKFISIAEETGLIHEIGDWVFYQAAKTMLSWLGLCTAENGCCQISVNMSARQFTKPEIGTAWINYLAAIKVPTQHMVIEITESLLLGDEVDIQKKLNRLREAGIKLALDDFGTGYSAMSYLKKFNIDYLKIDQSFVRDLDTDPNDLAITEAIIVMAHKLGLKTIAEGVETEQQKVILDEIGCDYMQGYFFAKPMPLAEFLSFVQRKLP